MRTAWFDLASGISGDMALGALAGAGRVLGTDVEDVISASVRSVGASVVFRDVQRGGLACVWADVAAEGSLSAAELRATIEKADVSDAARARALAGLEALVAAEAQVHGVDAADVHLHELSSPDTAADLVGAAAGLDALRVRNVAAAPVPLGAGWTSGAHGPLPLPAPATAELLRGAAVRGVAESAELVTPTGAAILVAHDCTFGVMPQLTLEAVGVGAGSRELDRPNVCRLFVGAESAPGLKMEVDVLLETNIDDLTPEAVGRTVEALFSAGAKDAWVTPIVMKKSRPAFMLSCLVAPGLEERALDLIFRETTTLGVRRREATKWTLPRETVEVSVGGARVRVKVGRLHGDAVTISPEYDDVVAASDAGGVSFRVIYTEAAERARRLLSG